VLIGQLERYEDLPDSVAELAKVGVPAADPDAFDPEGKLKWVGDEVVLNFGKSKGRSLRELVQSDDGRGLLAWILKKDFPEEVRRAVREALAGRFPLREAAPPAGPAVAAEPGLFERAGDDSAAT
jgi:hypothetical protein